MNLNHRLRRPIVTHPVNRILGKYRAGLLLASLGMLLQSCVSLPKTEERSTVNNRPLIAGSPGPADSRQNLPVLLIGDSLTVGGFGDGMEDYLLRRFGTDNVYLYASCGSSPEHWIRSGPRFITRCGFRERTPQTTLLYDYVNGKRPLSSLTPKVEDLIGAEHPGTVIVQLGTNWMDGMPASAANDQSEYGSILNRFVSAIQGSSSSVRQIIWITPPDSSHYSKAVQLRVKTLIIAAARKDSFQIVDSSRLTHYLAGKSGGDGIHYNTAPAKEWANQVGRELDGMLK